MFNATEITVKIFANKVRNNFPTNDVQFEFGRLQDEVKELEEALCHNGAEKELGGEFADVAIFSMAIARMKNIDAKELFANKAYNHFCLGIVDVDFAACKLKVNDLERALVQENQKAIVSALAQIIAYLDVIAYVKGIDLEAAIEAKVAFNATRVYTKM